MTDLRAALTDYLALRNRLGHELADAARVLPRFVTWMEHEGQSTVTITAAVAWSQQPNPTRAVLLRRIGWRRSVALPWPGALR